MAARKVFVVFGATGNQGGSVINHVLGDSRTSDQFKIRGITRDPSKPNAKALEARGVETAAANINDPASIKAVLKGAYAVFAITNFWEKMDGELETRQGKNIADAAKEAGVQHFIWSALLDVKKLTNGKYPNVDHFDSKAAVETYIREIGLPATFFMPGMFMNEWPGGIIRQSPPDNAWTVTTPAPPTTPFPLFDPADDTGLFVKAILTQRDHLLGKRVLAATDYYTPLQVLQIFKELYPEAGKEARYVQASEADFKGALAKKGTPDFVQQELYETMMFMDEFGYYGKANLDESHAILDAKPTSLKDFFKKSKAFQGLQ